MAKWKEDELAYDGSSEPQKRKLTPRERDILCRVIVKWQVKMREILALPPDSTDLEFPGTILTETPEFAWMDLHPSEVQLFIDMRDVLNPRKD